MPYAISHKQKDMRIGIDARFYGPLGKGLGRYTQKLVENLENIDQENQYIIFLRQENWNDYKPHNTNFHKVLADYRWYTLAEQINLPKKIRQSQLDLMHFPHFNVPILYTGRFVVTIHDLILTQYPTVRASTLGPLLYKIKHLGYKLVIASAVHRAKLILTVSNYTKSQIISHFKINESKIKVVYEGLDPIVKQESLLQKSILDKYQVKKPYFLYVGNAYPHKNLETLLNAFKKFISNNVNYYLVLVGKEDYFFERLKKQANELGIEKNVTFAGFVSDLDLPCLYQNATLYIFPSYCEGFGLPPLEAMSYGVPVAASQAASLPEVLGNAAYYFNPHKENELIESIEKLITDSQLRDNLIDKGLERVKNFNWQKLAASTLSLYKSV